MRITKKLFGAMAVLSLVMLFGPFQALVGQASAVDSSYALPYSGDGGNVSTELRPKEDNTSFYVFHKGNLNARVSLRDENSRNCSPYYRVEIGKEYFFINDVKEHYGNIDIQVQLLLSPELIRPTQL